MVKKTKVKITAKHALDIPVVSSSASSELNSGDALDGCSSIERWEIENGRGFWGSEANGYIYDKDL